MFQYRLLYKGPCVESALGALNTIGLQLMVMSSGSSFTPSSHNNCADPRPNDGTVFARGANTLTAPLRAASGFP